MSVLSFPSRSLPRYSQSPQHTYQHNSPIYHYWCFCFAYGPAYSGNYGYVMDDFGDAVVPPEIFGCLDYGVEIH